MEVVASPGAGDESVATPKGVATRSSGVLWLAWASATAIIAVVEWAMLVKQASNSLVSGQAVRLLPLTFGNWLAYTFAGVALLRLSGVAIRYLGRRMVTWRARLLVAFAAGLLASPYASWLARFTFSGPRARVMAHHSLMVVATTVAVALPFAIAVWLSDLHPKRRWLRLAFIALLTSSVLVVLGVSRAVMPTEYEPLHGFLSLIALLAACLAGSAIGRERRDVPLPQELIGAGLLTAVAGLAGFQLARSEADSWLLWSQSAGSRYLTDRWTFLSDDVSEAADAGTLVSRPNLDTEQTLAWRQQRAAAIAPHIVIFSIDGLLPSRVGAYGYKARPTTPNIDRLAKKGVRFTRAFSTYPATKQFNSTLLLGRLVPSHGVSRAPEAFREQAITRLLHGRGYHIMVQSWFEASNRNNFDPKYFKIDTNVAKTKDKKLLELPMEDRMVRVERHLKEAASRSEPIFLWMHLLSTHPVGHEFVPHPKFAWGDSRSERYDSAVAGTDLWLPELERLMEKHADPARPTIWVICSDHGVRVEEVGRDLYAHLVRVPLIIVGPGFEPGVTDAPVETSVDLAASVLDLAGIAPPSSYDGISLVPLLMRPDLGARLQNRVIPLLRGTEWRGAVQGPFKLLRYKKSFSFFDARSDPNEEHNLYAEQKPQAQLIWKVAEAEINRRLHAFQGKEPAAPSDQTDDED